ncbi:Ldh family oxidoreductase [Nakamurella flavida]|uniref:Ldh family oxidoreductase n=1 Tax=Nakamurella flavida TaxID=363630 RepID=A0A938YS50_9ACTN|nr:Ldh family oxidoreductase [Nakamurella flavida]MBM9477880.1 Ldh family oxidoreductase [Nakamurella flavida]MDP9778406.1 putative oxidoreductase [Nakamurella flavida]
MIERTLSLEQATEVGRRILSALGTPAAAADLVARSLAEANLCGHDSHGIIRLPWYASFVPDGRAVPDAEPMIVSQTPAVAVIDGRRCWGQVAAHLAIDVAMDKARSVGIGAVTVRSANHVGRLGEYVEVVAESGLVALMWCNADPSVAPFGGRSRMLGTNPFAVGIPADGDTPPVIVDFATAAVAEGKLRLDRVAGRSVAPGLIQDVQGRPSTDPEDFYAGGSLLPFGGHKGFGVAITVELLGGALSGNHVGFLPEYRWGNGVVLVVLDPAAFTDASAFADEIVRASRAVRDSPPADGVDHVMLPGDLERATRTERLNSGIPVPDGVWSQLEATAQEVGVRL